MPTNPEPLDIRGVDLTEAAVQEWADQNDLRLCVWLLGDRWVLSDKGGAGVLARGRHLGPTIQRAMHRPVTS